MWVMWNLTSFSLETVWVSVHDRCTVCAKHTIGSKIILDTPNGTPRWWGSSESSVLSEIELIMTQDRCMVCVECTTGLEIILDAPDGILRWRRSCGISLLFHWRQCYFRCKIHAQFVPNVPSDQKSFWTHLMVLLGDEAQVKAHFVQFGDSANFDAR
jgi:hypothetical protein